MHEYATFNVASDPGSGWALAAAAMAVVGLTLSLFIRRRRVWVRVKESAGGPTLVEVAGLARTEAPGLDTEVDSVVAGIRSALERT